MLRLDKVKIQYALPHKHIIHLLLHLTRFNGDRWLIYSPCIIGSGWLIRRAGRPWMGWRGVWVWSSTKVAALGEYTGSEPKANFRKVLISEGVDGRGSSLWFYYMDSINTNLTTSEYYFSLRLLPAGGNKTSARRILGTLSALKSLFLQTAYENLNKVNLIVDGNVWNYPMTKASSKDQRCKVNQKNKYSIIIESKMMTPVDLSATIESLEVDTEDLDDHVHKKARVKFGTTITLGKDDQQNLAL